MGCTSKAAPKTPHSSRAGQILVQIQKMERFRCGSNAPASTTSGRDTAGGVLTYCSGPAFVKPKASVDGAWQGCSYVHPEREAKHTPVDVFVISTEYYCRLYRLPIVLQSVHIAP